MIRPDRITLLTLSLLLAACGGGGDPVVPEGEDTGTGGSDSSLSPAIGSGVGDTFTQGELSVTAEQLLSGDTLEVSANIVDTDDDNALITSTDYYVTYSSGCSDLGDSEFSEDNATVTGTVSTTYLNNSCTGTDTLTVTLYSAAGGAELDSATVDIDAVLPDLGSGSGSGFSDANLDISDDSLSAKGTTEVDASIVSPINNNNLIRDISYYVLFDSECAQQGLAEFAETGVTVTDGQVTATYTADGCVGTDTLTFELYGLKDGEPDYNNLLATATGDLEVAAVVLGTISYTETTSTLLSLSQIENPVLPKQATLTFQVLDKNNNPVERQEVSFSLSNTSGGIELSVDSAITDAEGNVQVVLFAGSAHAKVAVKATTTGQSGGETIYTNSISHSITTGVADQDSFTIALSTYSTPGWDQFGEGTEVEVTAYVNDHFQNAVPDGTVVNFASDAGSIGATCETVEGSCSVTWYSAEPLPGADESGNLFTNDNTRVYDNSRVTYDPTWNGGLPGEAIIVAYTEGEDSYSDENGNNLFDDGESFEAMDEAFLDANENGIYDFDFDVNPREDFFDYDNDGSMTTAPDTYQGISCADSSTHCQSMVHVRSSRTFIVSSTESHMRDLVITSSEVGNITGTDCRIMVSGEEIEYTVNAYDVNGNTPPEGTEVSIDSDGLLMLSGDSFSVASSEGDTNGADFYFQMEADDTEEMDELAKPFLTITQIDGLERFLRPVTKLSNNTSVDATPDQLPVKAGVTVNVQFTDMCGDIITGNLDVVAELSNGTFAGGDTVQNFSTTTSDIDIDIITDGTPSYDDGGLTLTIFRPNSSGSSTATFAVSD